MRVLLKTKEQILSMKGVGMDRDGIDHPCWEAYIEPSMMPLLGTEVDVHHWGDEFTMDCDERAGRWAVLGEWIQEEVKDV